MSAPSRSGEHAARRRLHHAAPRGPVPERFAPGPRRCARGARRMGWRKRGGLAEATRRAESSWPARSSGSRSGRSMRRTSRSGGPSSPTWFGPER